MSLTAETWKHTLPGYEVSNKGRLRRRVREDSSMTKFTVIDRQNHRREVQAHRFTVSQAGDLIFWIVTEQGDAPISAIATGNWVSIDSGVRL